MAIAPWVQKLDLSFWDTWRTWANRLTILTSFALAVLLVGCSLPRVNAEDRLFLPLSVDFLDATELPPQTFEGTAVGGLSAIDYDRQNNRFYVLSDDRGQQSPARFYTLTIDITTEDPTHPQFSALTLDSVTLLRDQSGQVYPVGRIDPEGLVLTPRQTLLIASEGDSSQGVPPFIDEFDRATGTWVRALPIPQRYVPQTTEAGMVGVQNNLGFEALTLNPGGFTTQNGYVEPFRVFAATESALSQDAPPLADEGEPIRMLHYLVGDDRPSLLAEHLYRLDPTPEGVLANGLTELLVLDQSGTFLSLERTFGVLGAGAKLFQVAIANATDTSGINRFVGDLSAIQPVRKRLLLDFSTLGIPLDNLEGMTLGPRLPDGSQSLIVMSDDNFSDRQKTQFLLFRLRQS